MRRSAWIKLGAGLLALGLAMPAGAAVVLDPDLGGGAFEFTWLDGLGPIDDIGGTGEVGWSLTRASTARVAFSVTDAFRPGDEFGLLLGGTAAPWTTSGVVGDYFEAIYDAVLTAGTYGFSLEVTALAPDATGGTAFAAFDIAPIPLPAGAPLLVAALSGLGLAARRPSRG